VTRFEIAAPSIEDIFIERVGRLPLSELGCGRGGGRPWTIRAHLKNISDRRTPEFVAGRHSNLRHLDAAPGQVAAAVSLHRSRSGSSVAKSRVVVYVGQPTCTAIRSPPSTVCSIADGQGLGSSFAVSRSNDLEASRRDVEHGELTALLDVERAATGEAVFTLYTRAPNNSSTAVVARQAATSIAIADRLGRLGLSAADQVGLFATPSVTVRSPDPSKPMASSEAVGSRPTRR
jgi:hypothetical protein